MSGRGGACLAAAFVLGAIPFSQLIARLRGVDLRAVGSGNVGATNLARALGYGAGVLGLLLDAAKGAAAVLLARAAAADGAALEAAAGLVAVIGHSYSPFLRCRGGKGVATGAGAFAVLAPGALAAAAAAFGLVVAATRVVGLASVLAALVLPVAAHVLEYDRAVVAAAVIVAVLVIVRHRANLARLWRGEEHRLGEGPRA